MKDYKTSYILNKAEMLFLMSAVSGVQPSFPAKYILNRYLADSVTAQDAVEGLVFKKLVSKNGGKVVIEPVVSLIVTEALIANKLWIVGTENETPVFILRTENMYLCVDRYRLIEGAWKVTPYQSAAELIDEIDSIQAASVTVIDSTENQYEITPQNNFAWLEE